MPLVEFSTHVPRRPLADVLGVKFGASPRGNTYWSRIQTCPREHALGNLIQLRPIAEADALTMGSLFHWGHQHYFDSLGRGEGQQSAERKCFDALSPIAEEPGYDEFHQTLLKMFDAYWQTYVGMDKWRVLATELPLVVTDPIHYTTRLDLFVVDLNRNLTFAYELKSASSLNSSILEGYQLNQQTQGHIYLTRQCVDFTGLPPFGGCIVQIVTKGTKKTPPQCARIEVPISEPHLKAFEDSVLCYTRLEKEYARMNHPRNLTKCAGYSRGYSRCVYFDLCIGRPDLTPEDLKISPPPGFVIDAPVTPKVKFT